MRKVIVKTESTQRSSGWLAVILSDLPESTRAHRCTFVKGKI